jgi:2-oxoglutarate dehydrogenase E1 component
LLEYREQNERYDVTLGRVEQLYPLSDETLLEATEPLAQGAPIHWVQEEPQNMGAWHHWRARFGEAIHGHPLHVIARPVSASPATGSKESHKREQQELVRRAFDSSAS